MNSININTVRPEGLRSASGGLRTLRTVRYLGMVLYARGARDVLASLASLLLARRAADRLMSHVSIPWKRHGMSDAALAQGVRRLLDMIPGRCSADNGFQRTREYKMQRGRRKERDEGACQSVTRKEFGRKRQTPKGRVHFVGCAMDIWRRGGSEWQAPRHIEALGGSSYLVTIFEDPPRNIRDRVTNDGSRDGSREMKKLGNDGSAVQLFDWAARNPRVRVLIANSRTQQNRTERLAFCRNVLLQEALRSQSQTLVVMDLDCKPTLQPGRLREAVAAVSPHMGGWHALFANSLPMLYDFWALRSTVLSMNYDCIMDKPSIADKGSCFDYHIKLSPWAPPLPVDSAFGGVGVYSLAALGHSQCRYDGTTCEHVGFHLCLRRHGLKLAIAPSLVHGCKWELAACGACNRSVYTPSENKIHVRVLPDGSVNTSLPATLVRSGFENAKRVRKGWV